MASFLDLESPQKNLTQYFLEVTCIACGFLVRDFTLSKLWEFSGGLSSEEREELRHQYLPLWIVLKINRAIPCEVLPTLSGLEWVFNKCQHWFGYLIWPESKVDLNFQFHHLLNPTCYNTIKVLTGSWVTLISGSFKKYSTSRGLN